MKTVTNQNARKFNLDESTQKVEHDGVSYKIAGSSNSWVKLLNDTSKQKQMDIETQIRNNGIPAEGQPVEIIYSRGRFAGYTYTHTEIVQQPQTPDPVPDPVPPRRGGSGVGDFFMNTGGGTAVGAIIVAVAFGFVQKFLLFPFYSSNILTGFQPEVAQLSSRAGMGGITGIIAGVIMMLIFLAFVPKDHFPLFIVLEAIAFFIGLLIIGFILPALIYIGLVVRALLPVIIIVLIIVLFIVFRIKSRMRRSRRRRF